MANDERAQYRRPAIARSIGAGIACAAVTVIALLAWFEISGRVIWRSAYTDLPGQNSHELILRLEPLVMGLVAVIAGRLAAALSPALRWPAALLGVTPLLVLFSVSGRPFNVWLAYVIAIGLAMVGTYVTTWRRGARGAPNRAA